MMLYKIFFLIVFVVLAGCTKKTGKKTEVSTVQIPAYSKDIKPLTTNKCAVSGCHVTNFPFGDFNLYTDLKKRVDNGRINTLVFEQKLMPPSGSVSLTTDELDKFKRWIDNGARED